MRERVQRISRLSVKSFYPGYFSLVMATGIVSIACLLRGWDPVAWVLFGINLAAYPILWLINVLRLIRWPRYLLSDLTDHKRGPGFFTWVAGTGVLGNQVVLLANRPDVGVGLLLIALVLWLVITYAFFVAVVVSASKKDVEEALSGGWLLAAVATQSLAVLAALIAPNLPDPGVALLPALCFYLLGCMQYLLIIGPIFHRLVFLTMSPQAWTPLFWVNSGALSITTLAGGRLILGASGMPLLVDLVPFLKGFTLFFWAAATWWIPLLVLIGIWRHGLRRYPLTYAPEYWGLVFPLGMYTACSFQLVQATGATSLLVIPNLMVWVAVFVWTLTFGGLLRRLL